MLCCEHSKYTILQGDCQPMNPDNIQLETIDKMFQYESQARIIDQLDHEQALNFAKSYLKLYMKQQEVIGKLSLEKDLTD
jgi:hypothetical protein